MLDDISAGLFAGIVPRPTALRANELVPLVEWYWLRAHGHPLWAPVPHGSLERLSAALRSGAATHSDPSQPWGFIRIRRQHTNAEDPSWLRFLVSFQGAARTAGLSSAFARQLTGAVKEMEDNVHAHSGRSRSGLLAYLAASGAFEFVVVDRGIGVLGSLRQNSDLRGIKSHADALGFALGHGNSRFGADAGRGWGFDDLTTGIADANSRVRFRSGDALREVDGTHAGPVRARSLQRAFGTGLMVSAKTHA